MQAGTLKDDMKRSKADIVTGTLVVITVGVALGAIVLQRFPGVLAAGLGVGRPCSRLAAIRGLQLHADVPNYQNRCQTVSRLVAHDQAFELWQTPKGLFWIPSGESDVLCWLLGQQHQGYYGEIPRGVVLDGGAHVGVFVREALNAGATRIVAIEPGPENLECLRRNFAREIADGRVTLYPKGIWNEPDMLRFHRVKGNSAGDSFVQNYGAGDMLEIPVVTLDQVVSDLRLPIVDMIKLDIKGAEKQAIQGAAETIARWKPRLAVAAEHEDGDNENILRTGGRIRRDYVAECGPCFLQSDRVLPEVLLLR